MEILQSQTRKAALQKFVLLYGLSIALIFAIAYFVFNTPANLFKKSIASYKTEHLEQGQLLDKTDAMTTAMNKYIETDRSYQMAEDVSQREKLKEQLGAYRNEITSLLQDIENDSSSRKTEYSKRHVIHYLYMFRSYLQFRDQVFSDIADVESSGRYKILFNIARDSLKAIQFQREHLKSQLAQAGTRTSAVVQPVVNAPTTPNNTDAAAKAANERLITDLQSQLRQIRVDLNNCNDQKASISQSASQTAADLPQQQMATLLVDAGKKIYNQAMQGKNFKGGTIEQRAYFACARQVFEEAKTHYAVGDIDTYIRNIDAQIKKLSY